MKKLLVFPTWILVRIMVPVLSNDHPFKKKRITLSNWAAHSTPLNDAFAIIFWANAICLIIAGNLMIK